MTYGEIYNTIIYYAWGDATPPSGAQAQIVRMIASAQRKIQRDYNFWFMLYQYTFDTVAAQSIYTLPERFKEIEYCNISTPSGAKTSPLQELDLSSEEELILELSNATTQYPEYFMVDGANIRLYPIPSEIKTVNIRMWKFLDATPGVYATLVAYTDNISTYLAEAVIYHVLSDLKLMQDEWQSSQLWKQRFYEEMQIAQQEDVRRRQNHTGRYHGI